jgi:hypothetical protein
MTPPRWMRRPVNWTLALAYAIDSKAKIDL